MERHLNLTVKTLYRRASKHLFEGRVVSAFARADIVDSVRDQLAPQRALSWKGPEPKKPARLAAEQIAGALLDGGLIRHVMHQSDSAVFANVFSGVPIAAPLNEIVDWRSRGRERFEEAVLAYLAAATEWRSASFPSLLRPASAHSTAAHAKRAERPEVVVPALLLGSDGKLQMVDYQPHWNPLAFVTFQGVPLLGSGKSNFLHELGSRDHVMRRTDADACHVAVVDVLRVVTPPVGSPAQSVRAAFDAMTRKLVFDLRASEAVILCCDSPAVPHPPLKAATAAARSARHPAKDPPFSVDFVSHPSFLDAAWSPQQHVSVMSHPDLKAAFMRRFGVYLRDTLPTLLESSRSALVVWLVGFGASTEELSAAFVVRSDGAVRMEAAFAHWEADTSIFRALHLYLADAPPVEGQRQVHIVANDSDTVILALLHRSAFQNCVLAHRTTAVDILRTDALIERAHVRMPPCVDWALTVAALYILNGNDFVPRNRFVSPATLICAFCSNALFICDVEGDVARDPLVRIVSGRAVLSTTAWIKLYGCTVLSVYKARLSPDVTPRRLWDTCKGQLSAWTDRIRSLTYHFVFRNPSTVAVMVRDFPLLRKGEMAQFALQYWLNALSENPSPGSLEDTRCWTADGKPLMEDPDFEIRVRELARLNGCGCKSNHCESARCGCRRMSKSCRTWCRCVGCTNKDGTAASASVPDPASDESDEDMDWDTDGAAPSSPALDADSMDTDSDS
jgi:hypothetical protein